VSPVAPTTVNRIAPTTVSRIAPTTVSATWSATTLSFVGVFMPAVALMLGAIVLGERLTIWTLVGAVLILAGVALTLAPGSSYRLSR
jgi:drug/metabolite transporter (DMT)-like permease